MYATNLDIDYEVTHEEIKSQIYKKGSGKSLENSNFWD